MSDPLKIYSDFVASVPTRTTTDLIEILIEGRSTGGHRTVVLGDLVEAMYPTPGPCGPMGQTTWPNERVKNISTTYENALAVVADEINRRMPAR